MQSRTTLLVISGALALITTRLPAQGPVLTAIRFGALVNATGRPVRDAVVVIQADTIVRVGRGSSAIPTGARVIDLRRYTAIPGMIDVHTHMTYWRDKNNLNAPGPRSKDSVVMAAAANALKTLETGVTTVRDLGASNYTDIAMRDSINKGVMTGPRMFVAGFGLSKVTTPPRAGSPPGPPRGRVMDTTEIKDAIKAQVDAGADWIKMYGSTGSFQNVTGVQTFTDEEMRVAVETAHRYGKPIAIHSYGDSGGRAAMRAGAESVEHAAGLDVNAHRVGEARHGVRPHDRPQSLLCRECRATWLQCQTGRGTGLVSPVQPRNGAPGEQGGRKVRDGVGCRLLDVRREHARVGVVRESRHDAASGARHGHDDSGRNVADAHQDR